MHQEAGRQAMPPTSDLVLNALAQVGKKSQEYLMTAKTT